MTAARTRLEAKFAHRFTGEAAVSDLRAANSAAGWSSESLVFTAEIDRETVEYVIRLPPAGGGIFPHYDLRAQTLTHEFLHEHAIPTPRRSSTSPTATGLFKIPVAARISRAHPIGRPLVDLHWYEVFAMVRMGCCILCGPSPPYGADDIRR